MPRALDPKRAQCQIKRRSWSTVPIPDDEFLVVAVHDLFVTIQQARARGTHITPQGTAFLSDLSGSVLRYLEPAEHDVGESSATAHGALDSGPPSPLYFEKTKLEVYYPEGGLQAWLVVFGSWCGLMASIGMTNIMGTFQNYISQNQLRDYDESTIGWIFSLYAFLAFFCGIYVGPFFDKYGPRWLVLAGSICVVMDMMLLGLCTQYWHFLLVSGCLGGIGTALIFTPCIAAIGHWFQTGRGNATGIAVSSGALGGIIFPLMLEHLIPQIGFAWSTRILGCIYILLCVLANLLVKSRLPPIVPPNTTTTSATPSLQILRAPKFALTVAAIFLLEWALFVPLTYLPSYATAHGLSTQTATHLLVVLNVGSLIGRLGPSYLADRIGPFNTNVLVTGLAAMSILGLWWPLDALVFSSPSAPAASVDGTDAGTGMGMVTGTNTDTSASLGVTGLYLFALFFGFASGANISLAPVCVGALCRTESYGRYYATCFSVVSLGCLTGIPIAGKLIAYAGGGGGQGYWALILFTGSCYVGGWVALVAVRVVARGWRVWGVRY